MNVYYESTYEKAFMKLLQGAGWTPSFGPELHRRITDAILEDDLHAYLRSHYADKGLTEDEYETVIAKIRNVAGGTQYRSMISAVNLARDGYDFTPKHAGAQPFKMEYIDFAHPERNLFRCVNQFEFHQGNRQRIPDPPSHEATAGRELVVGVNELKTMIAGALKPERPLEIFRDYLYFPDLSEGEEKEIAVVCRYPQFFAARKLLVHACTRQKCRCLLETAYSADGQ